MGGEVDGQIGGWMDARTDGWTDMEIYVGTEYIVLIIITKVHLFYHYQMWIPYYTHTDNTQIGEGNNTGNRLGRLMLK
jgi:hypothetical protein